MGRVLEALGPVAVVRMVPVTVATAEGQRQRTEVILLNADGCDLYERIDREGHAIARDTVRAVFPGVAWASAFDYHAGPGVLVEVAALRLPPVSLVPSVLPLAEMPLAEAESEALPVGDPTPQTLDPAAEPEGPECHHCGSRVGPLVPVASGHRWPSGAQVLVCKDGCAGGAW